MTIKELIESVPADESGNRNIGEALEQAMQEAGYNLECNQEGAIRGASVIASPV